MKRRGDYPPTNKWTKGSLFIDILKLIKGLFWPPLKWTAMIFGAVLLAKGAICFGMWDMAYLGGSFDNLEWLRITFMALFGFNIYLYLRYRDGGTTKIVLSDGKEYFVDNRIRTKSKGEVYAEYPNPELNLTPVSDTEKNVLMECLEEYGKESAMYDVGTIIYAISGAMHKPQQWGYTIVDVHTENVVVGYVVMTDNGDEQYLTADEFTKFKENRVELT
mgnify:CR=1 FL=1